MSQGHDGQYVGAGRLAPERGSSPLHLTAYHGERGI